MGEEGSCQVKYRAVFLDFYGTLVHEDDDIILLICERIRESASIECTNQEIGRYWWSEFSRIFRSSHGEGFKLQRTIGLESLAETIRHFGSVARAEEIIGLQFEHWTRPRLYPDTKPFLDSLRRTGTPVYILSNIDRSDIEYAVSYHGIHAQGILTSEDVRAYKPRPELFRKALMQYRLKADDVIHIGDSLTSDVQGAQSLGIAAMWLNRLGKPQAEGIEPDYICTTLDEAQQVLQGRNKEEARA
ncbi:haloacid dehalogenase [Paenibacillus ihbetae]|uniref:Haloacid dehalogenase n=2 Tax=Paenibacillus ihbetae TaxID=1870820 RepID=A0A1B2E9H1_9BACL|nr:haloacid dehalogenase [Paenibacillus ihbetae]OOC59547.1 haloacid dehalogenase [Paenibacillus ihbetae]